MRYDRSEMLKNFLRTNAIDNETDLNYDELSKVDFAKDSGDLIIESLKTLLIAHSSGDGEQICFRKVKLRIEELSKE